MGSTRDLGARHLVSELKVKLDLLLRVVMALKKNRKQAQDSMLEEPIKDRVVPPESIGEDAPRTRED